MKPARLYLPDTNVFSSYAKGTARRLLSMVDGNEESLVLSTIVLAEMEYGWQKAPVATRRISRQQALVARLRADAFDADCANAYGLVKNILLHRQAKNARPSGERDMLIAAHALALDAVLVTHNTREFAGIPGLEVEDWEA
jgi:tRNA(fMet)-specific endonuclease VapC